MPLDVKDLSEQDKTYFQNRLANYSLDFSSSSNEDLVTIPSSVTTLYGSQFTSGKTSPIVLKTSSFDQVNQWIGIPDKLSENVELVIERPRPLRFTEISRDATTIEIPESYAFTKLNIHEIGQDNLTSIRTAAKAYLDGDSRKFKAYKPWIEKLFPVIEINIWPFRTVTVKSGSVLEFGPGAHVLVAHTLNVEEGGVVRAHGRLNVDVVIMQKVKPIKFYELSPALLHAIPRRTMR